MIMTIFTVCCRFHWTALTCRTWGVGSQMGCIWKIMYNAVSLTIFECLTPSYRSEKQDKDDSDSGDESDVSSGTIDSDSSSTLSSSEESSDDSDASSKDDSDSDSSGTSDSESDSSDDSIPRKKRKR